MKNDNLNIDKLFEDSLGDLRVEPNADSWEKIMAGVDAASGTSKKVFWRWVVIAAASVAVVAYFIFFRSCSTNGSAQSFVAKERFDLMKQEKYIIKTKLHSLNTTDLNSQKIISNGTDNGLVKTYNTGASKKENNDLQDGYSKNHLVNKSKHFVGKELKKSVESEVEAMGFNTKKQNIGKDVRHASIVEAAETQLDNKNNPVSDFSIEPDNERIENEEISKVNVEAPAPVITTGLQIEFGLGPAWVNSNIQKIPVFDNPLIEGVNDNKIMTGQAFVQLKYSVSRFYAKTGLRLSEFGHNTVYTISKEMHDTTGGYASWIMDRYWTYDTVGFFDDPNNPGMVYPILSPTYHIDTIGSQWNSKDRLYYEKTNVDVQNRYRYLEIPLLIGFQHNLNRLGFYADGGIGVGFMINTTGKYIMDNELKEIRYNNNPYKKYNVNYMFNVGVNYYLSNRWNIFAEFDYKSGITSIYKPEYSSDVKYTVMGVNFGLSYSIK